MKKSFIILSLIFTPGFACADQVSEENRLLKSWGLKFNTQGRLMFRGEQTPPQTYQAWKPDISAYQSLESSPPVQESLQPLVISSKQKSEK
jgi:hypothetical protein